VEFYNQVEAETGPKQTLEPVRGLANKAAEHAARIAGTVQLFENPAAVAVDVKAMQCGIQAMAWYLNEALRICGASNPAAHLLDAEREIAAVRHLLVDADPKRPAGISTEKAAACAVLRRIMAELRSLGWDEPLFADSGNGGHLIYRIEPDCGPLVPDLLKYLAYAYSDELVEIDTAVGNPARLTRISDRLIERTLALAGEYITWSTRWSAERGRVSGRRRVGSDASRPGDNTSITAA
jgi:hypothetical protein